MNKDASVAIIGMACRFPGGASSPENYWKLLSDGVDATREVPADRWSLERFFDPDPEVPGKAYVKRGGFLEERIDQFDARFFGISPREATPLDPQQRLLLEVAWEAFEDAGVVPERLQGSNTGVYMGGFTMDNKIHLLNVLNRDLITTHTAISSTAVMLSNRLSYTFDLRGPSMTVDTACSSSMVALHLACQGLNLGECELAIAGGVNVMLRPEYTIAMCKGGFLAADGRCKSFDARGDGYARGEGAGVLLLKRLEEALRDGDPIHAVIAGTGVNQDGRSDGITAPNAESQKALIREVYRRAGVRPEQIQYVESHGTGTRAGDLAESTSLGEALAAERDGDGPLWIGSVKSNIGHLEAAAGMAGVIKTVLALKHRTIPANLHFETPHPEIAFDRLRLRVPVRAEPWPEHTGAAGAAVNSFGYGGTNAHAIVMEPPPRAAATAPPSEPPRLPALILPISAASENALLERARRLSGHLESHPGTSLEELGYTLARHRTHHPHRLALVASSTRQLRRRLFPFTQRDSDIPRAANGPRHAHPASRLAFVYSGMGAQSWGMGHRLLAEYDEARRLLEECDATWEPLAGWSLGKLFSRTDGEPMSEPRYAQPANFALQLMLTGLARGYGVAPEGIIGHSVGEIAAAWAAGSLELSQALTLTYHRAHLQQRLAGHGRMAAISLSMEEAEPYLKPFAGRLEIAAINGPNGLTVAGDGEAVERLAAALTADQQFCRVLRVDVAYHSHQMDGLKEEFAHLLGDLQPRPPTLPLYSTVTGARIEGAAQDRGYWVGNMRQPVLFARGIDAMIADGFDTFFEIGPHPVLSASINDGLRRARAEGECLAALDRRQPEVETFATALASLYARGAKVDWQRPYPQGRLLPLPAYPWDRETLWSETDRSKDDRLGARGHPLLTPKAEEPLPTWQGEVTRQAHRYLPDHRIQDETIFPAAGFVEMALATRRPRETSVAIEGFRFRRTLSLDETPLVRLCLDADGSRFTIHSRSRAPGAGWSSNASGRWVDTPLPARRGRVDRRAIESRCDGELGIDDFYRTFAGIGLQWGDAFKTLRRLQSNGREVLAEIEIDAATRAEVADYHCHPTLLDGAFQSLLALRVEESRASGSVFVPVEIAQIRYHRGPGHRVWCHGVIEADEAGGVIGDLTLFDDQGRVCMELFGFRARALELRAAPAAAADEIRYTLQWERQPPPPGEADRAAKWLLFRDGGEIGAQLAKEVRARQVRCIEVFPGERFRRRSDGAFEVRRESREEIEALLRAVDPESLDAVVYLWGLDIPAQREGVSPRLACGAVDVIDLTHIAQGLEGRAAPRELTLAIALVQAQPVTTEAHLEAPGQSALVGVGRGLAIECPHHRIKVVDLNSRQPLRAGAQLAAELLGGGDESEVAFRTAGRFVNRLVRGSGGREGGDTAEPGVNFALDRLDPAASTQPPFTERARTPPGVDEVEIALRCCSLAADTLTASASTAGSGEPSPGVALRAHGSGVVVAVGRGVGRFSVGQEVVAADLPGLRAYVTLPSNRLLAKPAGLSFEQATALPDWIAAYHALFHLGALERGQSILIHHGANDLGLAAVRLAAWRGATVYATEWSEQRREYLRGLGIGDVCEAGSLGFADRIGGWSDGAGVDLVVGSLSGDTLTKSLEGLRDDGRLVTLGGRPGGDGGTVPAAALERNLRFARVDAARLWQRSPDVVEEIVAALHPLLADGTLAPLPAETLPATRLNDLLQTLSRGDYPGKLVVEMTDQPVPLDRRLPRQVVGAEASYLVTGGFGGLGLETVKWLAARGARHIAVLSRSGPSGEEALAALRQLRDHGVRLLDLRLDIADGEAVARALGEIEEALPPLRGVIHAAGVVDDATLATLDRERIERVLLPKAVGAWNLHHALRGRALEFFVCYSSITSLLGNVGQLSYAAANAFLDGLAHYRGSRGEAGLSINWGAIGDVGMVARDPRVGERLAQLGLGAIPAEEGLKRMAEALAERQHQLGVFEVDWQRWNRRAAGRGASRLTHLINASPAAGEEPAARFRATLFTSPPGERLPLLHAKITEQVSNVLRIHGSRIDGESTLVELGIDSLMATELTEVIRLQTGVRFRPLFIARGPTISEIARRALEELMEGAQNHLMLLTQT